MLQTHTQDMQKWLHAPQCYVIRTLPIVFFFNSYNFSKAEGTLIKLIQSITHENAATVKLSVSLHWT